MLHPKRNSYERNNVRMKFTWDTYVMPHLIIISILFNMQFKG